MDMQKKVDIFQTEAELADAAALLMVSIANNAIEARGRFVLSLSGGSTPRQLYILLSKPPFCDQMPWSNTFVFWGDERCVPADNDANNAHMAKVSLLDHIAIPPQNIFPVPVDASPEIAAADYEKTIINFFKGEPPCFDLILLGLGTNGHTASLFPNTDVVSETVRLVKEVYVEEQKMFRITMTTPLINMARNVLFMVEGAGKAEVLQSVFMGAYDPGKYPAQLIKPEAGNFYCYADKKAAALLP
jgi:6-phosphogluconolactonase